MILLPALTAVLVAIASPTVHAIKECIQTVRLRRDEPDCTLPQMTQSFCHAETCPKKITSTIFAFTDLPRDSCTLVAHLLLVDFGIFDVVLLPASICDAEIRKGNFTDKDVVRLLPHNEELVALRMKGSQLLAAMEHGIGQYYMNGSPGANPKLAGIRFQVDLKKRRGERVSKAETLSKSCRWTPVDPEKIYNVLTIESVANGEYGYDLIRLGNTIDDSPTASRMKLFLTETIWQYAHYVCTIRDPFRKPIQSRQPLKPKVIRVASSSARQMVLLEDDKPGSNQTISTI